MGDTCASLISSRCTVTKRESGRQLKSEAGLFSDDEYRWVL